MTERALPGRLSSLDLMPEDGQEDVRWALGELNARRRPQADILDELNGRLAVKALPPISRSAFNRKAVRIAAARTQAEENAAVYAAIAPLLTPERIDEAAIVVGEQLKNVIAAIADTANLTSEDAFNLAKGYQATVMAMSQSAEYKRKRLAELDAKMGEAVDAVKKAPGITADTRRKIMEQLGVVRADLQKGG